MRIFETSGGLCRSYGQPLTWGATLRKSSHVLRFFRGAQQTAVGMYQNGSAEVGLPTAQRESAESPTPARRARGPHADVKADVMADARELCANPPSSFSEPGKFNAAEHGPARP
jgi:hypothetical protein